MSPTQPAPSTSPTRVVWTIIILVVALLLPLHYFKHGSEGQFQDVVAPEVRNMAGLNGMYESADGRLASFVVQTENTRCYLLRTRNERAKEERSVYTRRLNGFRKRTIVHSNSID